MNAPEQAYPLDPQLASWLPTRAMTDIYLSHNDDTFNSPPLQINELFFNIQTVPLGFDLSGLDWQRLELFHDEQLIGVLTPDGSPLELTYHARRNGLHTFFARAEYLSGGELKTTSNYLTTNVFGVEIPEPRALSLLLGLVCLISATRIRAIEL